MKDKIQDQIIVVPSAWLTSADVAVGTKVLLAYCIDPTYTAYEVADMIGTTYNSVSCTRMALVKKGLLRRERISSTVCEYFPIG